MKENNRIADDALQEIAGGIGVPEDRSSEYTLDRRKKETSRGSIIEETRKREFYAKPSAKPRKKSRRP